jgi:2-polyprenyl-3-methyl-5-hydroxy-6-metoxy-1,4-benzoquinol methylase
MSQAKDAALPAYYSNVRPELVGLLQPAGLNVLEVGCAAGAMGAALLEKGAAQVVGLDIFEPALELARRKLTAAHRVDLNALPPLPYPEGHFHVMTFADVLEHLVEPAAVLRHLRRWLADDGRILISIPNIRHESVVLPLLVEGRWEYQEWGILDRTHLRFFTRDGVLKLLSDAGFEIEGRMAGVQTGKPSYILKAAELVQALGGDVGRFLEDCDIVQFVLLAQPRQPRAAAGPTAVNAARAGPEAAAEGPWSGSRRTRVLLVPDLDDPGDCLATALPAIARSVAGSSATLAIALPTEALERPPPVVAALPQAGLDLDLLITEQPRTDTGWEVLVGGATVVILTSSRPALAALAARLGVELQDASRDAQLSGAPPTPQALAAPPPQA